ncbi:MAG: hypothetical protein ACKVU1_15405 [bacterium]
MPTHARYTEDVAVWRGAGAILCVAILALGALVSGCSDNVGEIPPMEQDDDDAPLRTTPIELLTSYFETAYSNRDSILYTAMLDSAFTFEFLQADADSLRDVLGEENFWGRTLDLRSTGSLFRNSDVTSITLNLAVNANSVYLGQDCVGCRKLETTVTLRVATVGDGTEPLIFTVDSPQTFIAKLNTADSLWVLWQQIDRPRSAAKTDPSGAGTGVESKSWGEIKGLYR